MNFTKSKSIVLKYPNHGHRVIEMFGEPGSLCFPDSRDIAIKRLGFVISKPPRLTLPTNMTNGVILDSRPMTPNSTDQLDVD